MMRGAVWWYGALLALAGLPVQAAPGAEYAVRYQPDQGGPKSGKALLALLGGQAEHDKVVVQYYAVTSPPDAPLGFAAILRARSKPGGKKAEVTWKYRGEQGFPAGDWICPLLGKAKSKQEVDVALLADGTARKAYSMSCTAKGTVAEVVPPTLAAQAKGCNNQVRRYDAGSFEIEEWQLASGLVIEVSQKRPDNEAELAQFRANIVDKLLAAGARPLDSSKSVLGSECGG